MKKTKYSFDIKNLILIVIIYLIFQFPIISINITNPSTVSSVLIIVFRVLFLSSALLLYFLTRKQVTIGDKGITVKKNDYEREYGWDEVTLTYYGWDMLFVLRPKTLVITAKADGEKAELFIPCSKKYYYFVMSFARK